MMYRLIVPIMKLHTCHDGNMEMLSLLMGSEFRKFLNKRSIIIDYQHQFSAFFAFFVLDKNGYFYGSLD